MNRFICKRFWQLHQPSIGRRTCSKSEHGMSRCVTVSTRVVRMIRIRISSFFCDKDRKTFEMIWNQWFWHVFPDTSLKDSLFEPIPECNASKCQWMCVREIVTNGSVECWNNFASYAVRPRPNWTLAHRSASFSNSPSPLYAVSNSWDMLVRCFAP